MKKPKKQPVEPEPTRISGVDSIHELAETLRTLLARATQALKVAKRPSPAMVREARELATELRKVEAACAKRTTELTMPQIVAWLRHAVPDDRARISREIESMSRTGGVLG